MTRKYNAPNADPSTIGKEQFNTHYWQKKALIEARTEQFFMPLANVVAMPKHFGKTIKRYHYLPMLSDANINDEGINMEGFAKAEGGKPPDKDLPKTATATADGPPAYQFTNVVIRGDVASTGNGYVREFFVGYGIASGAAKTAADILTLAYINKVTGGTASDITAGITAWKALGTGFTVDVTNGPGAGAETPYGGNLYGSSRDVGTITGKMPVLSETGGRVNRVGFRRIEIEGSIAKFGIFNDYTQESLDFDTDAELDMHVNREMVTGATKLTEDQLQLDLLTSAGVVRYAGAAKKTSEIVATFDYNDIVELGISLDKNRCPKKTTIVTGTRMIDTRVIPAARIMYVGSEMIPTLKAMRDYHNNAAFIPIEKYAAGTTLVNGEIGSLDAFRIVVVPEMMLWESSGGTATADIRSTDGKKADVFPMLVVGDASFTTIGFQTDGKTVKFKITSKKPGRETADWFDPYGEKGFMSIKWYYGFMALRPERIALVKTALKASIPMPDTLAVSVAAAIAASAATTP